MPLIPRREYALLPGPTPPGTASKGRRLAPRLLARAGITKRYTRLIILTILSLLFFVFFVVPSYNSGGPPSSTSSEYAASPSQHGPTTEDAEDLPLNLLGYPPYPDTIERNPAGKKDTYPPLYERYTAWEDSLPQNDEDAPWPDGREAKYVFLANHQRYAGWGNALQEMILNAHLTYLTGRGFVYNNYTWDIDGPVYAGYNERWRPSRIPISSMVAGPLVGYPFLNTSLSPNTRPVPRAISKNHFHKICPDRRILSSEGVLHTLQSDNTAKETMDAFVKNLTAMEERCVELERDSPQLFDIWIMGSSRVHDIWPVIASSPILTQFTWSPLIQRMFIKNRVHFLTRALLSSAGVPPPSFFAKVWNLLTTFSWEPKFVYGYTYSAKDFVSPIPALESSAPKSVLKKKKKTKTKKPLLPAPTNPLPLPVLALHLRRGDFKDHCFHLANWSSTYTGLNTLPQLPDHFVAPPRPYTPSGDRINIPFPLSVAQDADGDKKRRERMGTAEREEEEERYKDFVGGQKEEVRRYERAYQVHCWPEVQDVVRRVREVVREWNEMEEVREREKASSHRDDDEEEEDEDEDEDDHDDDDDDDHHHHAENETPHENHLRKKRSPSPSPPKTQTPAERRKQKLRRVYIMTNGDPLWLAELKTAVQVDAARSRVPKEKEEEEEDRDGWGDLEWDWEGLSTTRDLDVGWEEKHVSQALDMYVGQRAELFVGNGFSSLTANIVLLRMANGLDPRNTRFF